jgi:uncharacterized protein YdeI (YjbR/CyaY-like superfamily)
MMGAERGMSMEAYPLLDARTRRRWRKWLEAHHASASGIWLVFHKRHTGVSGLSYDDAVEEALCYGWIDSILKRLDDSRYVRKFTPRKASSRWSTANRRRYADLARRGLLTPAGLRRAPTALSGDAPRPSVTRLPSYMERALKANARAWEFFQELAPSHRRAYIGWIDSAKREETRARRLREAVRLLAAGRKLGMK